MIRIDTDRIDLIRKPTAYEAQFGKKVEVTSFHAVRDLVQYIGENIDERGFVERAFEKKLTKDPDFARLRKAGNLLRDVPGYASYRRNSGGINGALINASNGRAISAAQKQLIDQIRTEIAASKVQLSGGQVVFRGFGGSDKIQPGYTLRLPQFLSASLNPVIAINHGFINSHGSESRRPTAMALTLARPQYGIFTPYRRSPELEILFDCGAQITIARKAEFGEFDFVEATLL